MNSFSKMTDEAETMVPGGASAPLEIPARQPAGLADLALLVGGTAADEGVIAYGETIADAFGAHLDVFLAHHLDLTVLPAAPGAGTLADLIAEQGRREGDAVEKELRKRLDRLAVAWELRRADGTFDALVPDLVRLSGTCDLAVIPQASAGAPGERTLMEAVIFAAGSGTLLVPGNPAVELAMPQTVLIGWADTPQCAHAVAAALPFLRCAAQVVLARVAEGGAAEQRRREPMADMARHLARHGIRVEMRELPYWRHASEGLMNEADAIGAGMIVIGAYGHSRLRELLLGGVTRELLRKTRLPLLLAH